MCRNIKNILMVFALTGNLAMMFLGYFLNLGLALSLHVTIARKNPGDLKGGLSEPFEPLWLCL